VLGVDGSFSTIPTVENLRGREFFVPARTLIVVFLLSSYEAKKKWPHI
jgi:hypothetical protein